MVPLISGFYCVLSCILALQSDKLELSRQVHRLVSYGCCVLDFGDSDDIVLARELHDTINPVHYDGGF